MGLATIADFLAAVRKPAFDGSPALSICHRLECRLPDALAHRPTSGADRH